MNSPAEKRVRLKVHYDGSGFLGWQIQAEGRTVQGELEAAASRLTNRATRVVAAGRTDTGVHATGQIVSLAVPDGWRAPDLRRALNAVLPKDIWIEAAEEAPPRFHARFDARARGYEYRVGTAEISRSPFHRRWCWPLAVELDRDLLARCASEIMGEHSFLAFAKTGQEERGDRCRILRAEWRDWEGVGVRLEIRANRFLHHMVRYLTGTMVEIARGKRPFEELRALLENAPGVVTSPPAPAQGLFFTYVEYDPIADPLETEA